MPSSLKTFEEFDQLLAAARAEVDAMAIAEPNDSAIASVKRQQLDNYPVAASLYELASYVIYWGHVGA
jgi:hypothetical protein